MVADLKHRSSLVPPDWCLPFHTIDTRARAQGKDDKGKKGGKDKGKPADDPKEGEEDEDEEGGGKPALKRGVRLAFSFPAVIEPKETVNTTKPLPRKALVRYEYSKLAKLPISVALRDFFKFDGLTIDVYEDVNTPIKKKKGGEEGGDGGEAEGGGDDGEGGKKKAPEFTHKSFHLGSIRVRLGEFQWRMTRELRDGREDGTRMERE